MQHDPARELLQSVVDVARAIFGAEASSIFLLDAPAGELVFEAVAGNGADFLIGTRMPSTQGIAGWVVGSGQAMVVGELAANPVFAKDVAESTGYLPQAIMAAPLLSGDEVLGVLEVLDPVQQSRSNLDEIDLLSLFAGQAATALRVVSAYRPARDQDVDVRLLDAFRDFLVQAPSR